MRELLNAIKSALQAAETLSYVRDVDIYITPHLNYIPAGVQFPAIGIKDENIARAELASEQMEYMLRARLVVYVDLAKAEASVTGDAATEEKGVLQIEEDLLSVLDENLLGTTGMISALSPSSSGSELFGDESETLQRKIIDLEYVKEGERP